MRSAYQKIQTVIGNLNSKFSKGVMINVEKWWIKLQILVEVTNKLSRFLIIDYSMKSKKLCKRYMVTNQKIIHYQDAQTGWENLFVKTTTRTSNKFLWKKNKMSSLVSFEYKQIKVFNLSRHHILKLKRANINILWCLILMRLYCILRKSTTMKDSYR